MTSSKSEAAPAARYGAIAGAIIGTFWAIGAARAMGPPWSGPIEFGACLIAIIIGSLAWTRGIAGNGSRFRADIYVAAVVLEGLTIALVLPLLPKLGLEGMSVPLVGIIVGLHFVGLWLATRAWVFLFTSVSCCAVCAAAMILLEPRTAAIASGVGMAVALWISTAWAVR